MMDYRLVNYQGNDIGDQTAYHRGYSLMEGIMIFVTQIRVYRL
jgi:hypothetical protein